MAFDPLIDIIVEQPAVLVGPDLSLDGLFGHFPGLAQADAIGLTGSTAAGWSNTFSDVDLYVFSDHALELPQDETMETWPGSIPGGPSWITWMGVYGDARVDLKVFPTNTIEILLASYVDGQEPEFSSSSGPLAQEIIYRISAAKALTNSSFFEKQRELIFGSSYARALSRHLKAYAENALMDVAGQLRSGDFLSAQIAAEIAAFKVTDACLVAAGSLVRGEKWILRRLEATPECGISLGDYLSEVVQGPRSGEGHRDYADRVARWSQHQMLHLEDKILVR